MIGISEDGVVAGQWNFRKYTGEGNAFTWKNGVFTTFSDGLAKQVSINAISGNGVAVGTVYADKTIKQLGFFKIVAGRLTVVRGQHVPISAVEIYGINNSGMLAVTLGKTQFPRNPPAFSASSKVSLLPLKVVGGHGVRPFAINNLGTVAGGYFLPGMQHLAGFVSTSGVSTSVAVPGASDTRVNALNDAGDLAGVFATADVLYTAFVEHLGVFTPLAPPGAASGTSSRNTINAARQVLVNYIVYQPPEGIGTQQVAIATPADLEN